MFFLAAARESDSVAICVAVFESAFGTFVDTPLGIFDFSVSDRLKPARLLSDGFSGRGVCGGGFGGSANRDFKDVSLTGGEMEELLTSGREFEVGSSKG